jgi:hypothetical protein
MDQGVGRSLKHRFVSWLRRREVYAQDKFLGIAEMARALDEGRSQPMPPDFHIHMNELTLMIQRAGNGGASLEPTTTFAAFDPLPDLAKADRDYRAGYRPRRLESWMTGVVASLHKR